MIPWELGAAIFAAGYFVGGAAAFAVLYRKYRRAVAQLKSATDNYAAAAETLDRVATNYFAAIMKIERSMVERN